MEDYACLINLEKYTVEKQLATLRSCLSNGMKRYLDHGTIEVQGERNVNNTIEAMAVHIKKNNKIHGYRT